MEKLNAQDLLGFSGSEHWHKHSLVPNVLLTDGARHVADVGKAYWLIDEIAISQLRRAVKAEEFQVWNLKVTDTKSAELTCEDGNEQVVYRKKIEWTDFPLDEIKFYVGGDGTNRVIMLPSEY